jgi:hypothetical protein
MSPRSVIVAKKFFSLTLIFNALLTIAFATSILANFWFTRGGEPFSPYLFSANLFLAAIVAAVINIFPSAALGRSLHTGRILFHHYFYGFLLLALAAVYVVLFSPVPLISLFFVFNESVTVNVGKFLILGGLTLVLDDLPDVSKQVEFALNNLKDVAGQHWRIITAAQLLSGAVCLYIPAAISLAILNHTSQPTLANLLCAGTTFVTGVTAFIFVDRQAWRKISPELNR